MKFLGALIYTAFVTVLFAIALLLVGTLLPLPGNYQVKIVKSGSMEPTIQTGAVVVVKPLERYQIDDIITFGPDRAGQIPTTHRIVEEATAAGGSIRFFTKGDANDARDRDTVAQRDIIGKVLFSIPHLGFILSFAREPLGFVLLVGIPAGIIILDELMVILREVTAMRKEKREPTPQYDI